jgi:hypothetical protein
MQESQSLGDHFLVKKIKAGRVAARPGEAGDKTKLDRVLSDAEHDRDRRGRGFGRRRSGVAARRSDNGHTTANQVSHHHRQAIVLAFQPVVLHLRVLAIDVATFAKALAECRHIGSKGNGRSAVDEPDHWRSRLLRPRRHGPNRRAPESRNELPSSCMTRKEHSEG